MSKIYEYTLPYLATKSYVDFTFRRFYSNYIVIGRENIPADAPVIFAPNHTNALMDALAIASLIHYPKAVVFLARADIFNHPVAAKILRFTKIMPAFRMRDGVKNLGRNQEIFDMSVDVLKHKHALCIMPEGNQETERKLRPLVKGIFRIAFAAQEPFGTQQAVKIIPVGLDFGHLEKYGKHILINIGKPIEVAAYMQEFGANPVSATNQIREKLRSDLSDLSFDLACEKHYYSFEKTVEILENPLIKTQKDSHCPVEKFHLRCKIARTLSTVEQTQPETAEQLAQLSESYFSLMEKHRLRTNWTELQSQSGAIHMAIMALAFPIFAWGFACNCVPFLAPVWLRKKVFKAEFTGFFSSLQWAAGALLFPIFYAIMALPILISEGFFPAILVMASAWVCGKIALKYYGLFRKTQTIFRLKKLAKKEPATLSELGKLRGQIISIYTESAASING